MNDLHVDAIKKEEEEEEEDLDYNDIASLLFYNSPVRASFRALRPMQ